MNFLNKMERKFGRYAIHNLSAYIIALYVAGYLLYFFAPASIFSYLTLEPYYILHGQIWRLVTWILIPPESPGIFTIIMLFFYYSLGTSLEQSFCCLTSLRGHPSSGNRSMDSSLLLCI